MSTEAGLRRALVGSSRFLSSSKVGDVFGSSLESNRACGLNSKFVICSYSRQFGSRSPREQENDSTPPKPRWEAGKRGERYANTTGREVWRRGEEDGRGQGREDKVSSYEGSSSKIPNISSRPFSPRQSSSQFVSDWTVRKEFSEQGSGSASNSKGTVVRPRAKNPLIERLRRMQEEIAKGEAAALALAAEKAEKEDCLGPSSEGDSLAPNSDTGSGTQFGQKFRDCDDLVRFDWIRENSFMAGIVESLNKIPGSHDIYRPSKTPG